MEESVYMNKTLYLIFLSLIFVFHVNANYDDSFEKSDQNEKILVDKLKTLVFQKQYLPIKGAQDAPIVIDNVNIPKENKFIEKMKQFINKPVTIGLLQEIKVAVASYFRDQGYSLVGVHIPAGQDITDGDIHVIIQIAKLGKIQVEGGKYFSDEKIKKQIRIKRGQKIESNKIAQDLEWLNDNPFRRVSAIYMPSDDLNQTDILFQVEDKFPLRGYLGYENNSYAVAGSSRIFAGFNAGNLFKLDQQLNFQYISALEPRKWWGISGNYIVPLPWRNIFKVIGSYSKALSDEEPFRLIKGTGWTLAGRYEIPLPIIYGLSHDLIFGLDFKRTNNFLTFADSLIYNRFIDIFQLLVKYQGIRDDNWGITSFEISLFYSPGNVTAFNKSSNFQQERDNAKSDYVYTELDIERLTKLPWDLSWVSNLLGQYSFSKLLLSEQLAIGGNFTVRGFMENDVTGDSGVLFKNEIRSPKIHFQRKRFDREVQFLAFIDFGYVTDVDPNIVDKHSAALLSAGPGLRYHLATYITIRFDYGFQIFRVKDRVFQETEGSRGHLSVIASY